MGFIYYVASQPANNKASRAFHYVLILMTGLPLVYFLSVGPAVILVVKVPSLRNEVRAIYAPVIWLHDQNPALKKTVDEYLAFWEVTARQI
jgi:lipid-A-disaccharide synthase-like uncharacterized protein